MALIGGVTYMLDHKDNRMQEQIDALVELLKRERER